MLYNCLSVIVKWALQLYCSQIVVQHKALAATKGPLLITANHPNSFLDAIIIGSLFKHPVHFLARGDAFNKPWHRTLLSWLNMIPIYRISEGKDKLHLNEYAFEQSHTILKNKGIVLIFIEGVCVHQHSLQPFKKGAARIALQCWQAGIPLQVMPVGIAYSHFSAFNKSVVVQLSPTLPKHRLTIPDDPVKSRNHFNRIIHQHLQKLIHPPVHSNKKINILLAALGWIGWFIHRPLYKPLQQWVAKKTKRTVFYHSVLFGVLLLVYPLYLLCVFGVAVYLTDSLGYSLLITALLPILARIAVRFTN